MASSEHCRRHIFQIYNVQNLKITRITTFRICNVVYQVGSRWDPKCVFNFLRFFERTLYKSNYIIFILSCCGTHTKIRSKLVDIVTGGSQKITLWGPQRTPLGILRVKVLYKVNLCLVSVMPTVFFFCFCSNYKIAVNDTKCEQMDCVFMLAECCPIYSHASLNDGDTF